MIALKCHFIYRILNKQPLIFNKNIFTCHIALYLVSRHILCKQKTQTVFICNLGYIFMDPNLHFLTSGRYGQSFSNNLHNPVFKRGNSKGRLEFRTTRTCASGTTPNVFKYDGIALSTVHNTIFLISFRPLTKCQQRYSSHGPTPISTIRKKKYSNPITVLDRP